MTVIQYLTEQLAYAQWSLARYREMQMDTGTIAMQERLITRLQQKLAALR